MLVWRTGNVNITATALCTILMVRAVLTGRLTGSGFDLASSSSVSSKRLCVFGVHGVIYIFFIYSLFLLHILLYLLLS